MHPHFDLIFYLNSSQWLFGKLSCGCQLGKVYNSVLAVALQKLDSGANTFI